MNDGGSTLRKLLLIAVSLWCLSVVGCSHPKQTPDANLKRYHLTGSVVAIDKPNKSLTVDGDEIPGFMSAMQMPYDVKDTSLLDKLAPGDRIAADIVVKNDESWIENIRVTAPSAPKPNSNFHSLFQLVNPTEAKRSGGIRISDHWGDLA